MSPDINQLPTSSRARAFKLLFRRHATASTSPKNFKKGLGGSVFVQTECKAPELHYICGRPSESELRPSKREEALAILTFGSPGTCLLLSDSEVDARAGTLEEKHEGGSHEL